MLRSDEMPQETLARHPWSLLGSNAGLIGQADGRERLATPCLVVDLPVLKRNITQLAQLCRESGLRHRPHAKAHKCAAVARLQMAAGASGICVATVGEAEIFATQSLSEILLTSTFSSSDKILRIVELCRHGVVLTCVVDSPSIVAQLAQEARQAGQVVPLLVDLDLGRHRSGVATVDAAVALAQQIESADGVRFAGLQAYAGQLSHMRSFEERRKHYAEIRVFLKAVCTELERQGSIPGMITGGSTGSFFIDRDMRDLTEVQCGSYAFMDTEYEAVDCDGQGGSPFAAALFLRTTVTSRNHRHLATTDGGDKRLASKYNMPPRIARGLDGPALYRTVSDEHGMIELPEGVCLPLGASIECAVPHCDPSVNLFDVLHVVDGTALLDIWPIDARGA